MLTAFNESAKRIGGPDWGKQIGDLEQHRPRELPHHQGVAAVQGGQLYGEPHRYGWNNIHAESMAEEMVRAEILPLPYPHPHPTLSSPRPPHQVRQIGVG